MDGFTEKHAVFSNFPMHESRYAAAGDKWLSSNELFRAVAIGYTVYQTQPRLNERLKMMRLYISLKRPVLFRIVFNEIVGS